MPDFFLPAFSYGRQGNRKRGSEETFCDQCLTKTPFQSLTSALILLYFTTSLVVPVKAVPLTKVKSKSGQTSNGNTMLSWIICSKTAVFSLKKVKARLQMSKKIVVKQYLLSNIYTSRLLSWKKFQIQYIEEDCGVTRNKIAMLDSKNRSKTSG